MATPACRATEHDGRTHAVDAKAAYSGDWYTLVAIRHAASITIGYYIDALTVAMFAWSR